MAASFQPGEVVHLKSGGPSMTVDFEENSETCCTWFDGTKRFQDRFATATLERGPSPSDPTIAKRPVFGRISRG